MPGPYVSAYHTVTFKYSGVLSYKLYLKLKGLPRGWTRRNFQFPRYGYVRFSSYANSLPPGDPMPAPDLSWLPDYTMKLVLLTRPE